MKKIVIATFNKDKYREIKEILSDIQLEVVPLFDFIDKPVEETGESLSENAFIKAKYAYSVTNLPSVADDTGLEVFALNGEPGIYAARYAGENATYKDNLNKLLENMRNVEEKNRGARFVTMVCYYDGEKAYFFEGELKGNILETEEGEDGFGYDPVFYVPEKGKTLASMESVEKNRISHRFRAFTKFKNFIKNLTNDENSV